MGSGDPDRSKETRSKRMGKWGGGGRNGGRELFEMKRVPFYASRHQEMGEINPQKYAIRHGLFWDYINIFLLRIHAWWI